MKSRLAPIFAVTSITGFADSLVGIFVPIFLLTLGYSLTQVMAFILVRYAAILAFALLPGLFGTRLSLKSLMVAQAPVQIAFLALLATLPRTHVSIFVLALLMGLQASLYYIPLHIFFTKASDRDRMGHNVGLFLALPDLLSTGAPLLAGFIAARFGFTPVFLLSAVLVAVSLVPLARIPSYTESVSFRLSSLRTLYAKYRTYFWLEIIENIQEEMDGVIWPLAIYLFLHSTLGAGFVATLISAGTAMFTYLIGRRSDHHASRQFMLRTGALIMLALWATRLLSLSTADIIIISALVSFATVLVVVPFNTVIYHLAGDNNTREFILFREIPVFIARAIVYTTGLYIAMDISRLFWLAIATYALFACLPGIKRIAA